MADAPGLPALKLRGVNCTPVEVPLRYVLGTSAAVVRAAPLLLVDVLTEEGAHIPLVHRGSVSSHSLKLAGVKMNAWDSELWNVADWSRAK